MMKIPNRRYVRWAIEIIIIVLASAYSIHEIRSERPNIILVTFDALRPDHLGFYGYSKNTSPFLDSLAGQSIVFTNCVAQSAATPPSVAALFTSQYPYLDGLLKQGVTLKRTTATLTEFLKKKGYQTIGIVGSHGLKSKFQFSRGFDYYDDQFDNYRNADEMLGAVRQLFIKRKFSHQPIFLWIHFREPHYPYAPPENLAAEFFDPITYPDDWQRQSYVMQNTSQKLTKADVRKITADYDGNIQFADHYLGGIFYLLSQKGVLQHSVVIFTADHAELLGEHNIIGHNFLYYKCLHVPLILKIPGYPYAKVRNDAVSLVDIFPTVIDLLGQRKQQPALHLRGQSLLKKRTEQDVQYSEFPDQRSIIKDGRRLSYIRSKNKFMLSYIREDPEENYEFSSVDPDLVKKLFYDLTGIVKSSSREQEAEGRLILDDADIAAFRSLGYLQ
jgi:arylsulfatase A-like enzyme